MRAFVRGLGTRDEKRQGTERRGGECRLCWQPVAYFGIIASLSYRGVEINTAGKEGQSRSERESGGRGVWTCLPLACLSLPSINSVASQPAAGGRLSSEPRTDLQIHTDKSHVLGFFYSAEKDGFTLQSAVFTSEVLGKQSSPLSDSRLILFFA